MQEISFDFSALLMIAVATGIHLWNKSTIVKEMPDD
jgi:hypothetical protein|tara:strand:- start:6762 stop:6869 length:108 start_codon:yes stop_codon:yes gene_type:complete